MKSTREQIGEEIRDPRLYSNLRNMFASQEARVKAHKNLDRRKDHTVLSAMREGFRNKAATIEPSVFKSFANALVEQASREDQSGDYDESDPQKPFRDSALQKALGKDQNRPPQKPDQPPRADYARPDYFREAKE